MIVAIMQPYFFPYIGYFQLMAAADVFVFLDDAQYVEQRWMNRNRIRHGARSTWLTLPVRRDKLQRRINEREYRFGDDDLDAVRRKLRSAYLSAPHWSRVYPLINGVLDFVDPNVASFNINLLTKVAAQLGIKCLFMSASGLKSAKGLAGQARILKICSDLSAASYINAIGGVDLYDEAAFAAAGVDLRILRTRVPPILLEEASEHLSIIDGLMHDGVRGCVTALQNYELLAPEDARRVRLEAIGSEK